MSQKLIIRKFVFSIVNTVVTRHSLHSPASQIHTRLDRFDCPADMIAGTVQGSTSNSYCFLWCRGCSIPQ